MEKLTNNSFNFENKEVIDQISQVVKHLSAVDCIEPKQFNTVDLWSIQRSYKTLFNRRSH